MGTLYLVSTPIGNLEDVSLRALRLLKEVSLIAAEDTRTTRKLLTHYGIRNRLISYHEHNRVLRIPQILGVLKEHDVALVSEAGAPAISDPGRELVRAAADEGLPVVPIPGPSAVTAALAVSGLPASQFVFLGFLPRRRRERRQALEGMAREQRTTVLFEAPHRLRATLEDLRTTLGERWVAVCRELTKVHEEVFHGTPSQALEHFTQPRGEFTLVVEGCAVPQRGRPQADTKQVLRELTRLRQEGLSGREAVARVSQELGIPRREAYRAWVEMGRGER